MQNIPLHRFSLLGRVEIDYFAHISHGRFEFNRQLDWYGNHTDGGHRTEDFRFQTVAYRAVALDSGINPAALILIAPNPAHGFAQTIILPLQAAQF